MSNRITDHLVPIQKCALDLLVGDLLGEGSSRSVYPLAREPDKVLKIEYAGGTFHNVVEWKIWQAVKATPVADWFAPCVTIDGWGTAMIQMRADVFECEDDFLRELTRTRGGHVPNIFDDVRYNNFGMFDGRVTCVDYGYSHIFERISREMMIEFGYMVPDPPGNADITDEGQLRLGL